MKTTDATFHLIIGKWSTPNDSRERKLDDTHKVKAEILKKVGKSNFSKEVGNNPDIDIIEGVIFLRGTKGKFKKKPKYYDTGIAANDYFVLRFIPFPEKGETEIQVLIFHSPDSEVTTEVYSIVSFQKMFVIPNNETLILTLVDTLTDDYLRKQSEIKEDVIILLK